MKKARNDGTSAAINLDPALTFSGSPRPVLMRPDDICDLKFAAHYSRKNIKTIRRWVKTYGIGRQSSPQAPVEISRIALEMVLQGDWEALELLRVGKRSEPSVLLYLDFVGVPA